MASRHTLATKVHSYRNANDPESLKQAISEVFAEVASGDAGPGGENAFELITDLPEEKEEHGHAPPGGMGGMGGMGGGMGGMGGMM